MLRDGVMMGFLFTRSACSPSGARAGSERSDRRAGRVVSRARRYQRETARSSKRNRGTMPERPAIRRPWQNYGQYFRPRLPARTSISLRFKVRLVKGADESLPDGIAPRHRAMAGGRRRIIPTTPTDATDCVPGPGAFPGRPGPIYSGPAPAWETPRPPGSRWRYRLVRLPSKAKRPTWSSRLRRSTQISPPISIQRWQKVKSSLR